MPLRAGAWGRWLGSTSQQEIIGQGGGMPVKTAMAQARSDPANGPESHMILARQACHRFHETQLLGRIAGPRETRAIMGCATEQMGDLFEQDGQESVQLAQAICRHPIVNLMREGGAQDSAIQPLARDKVATRDERGMSTSQHVRMPIVGEARDRAEWPARPCRARTLRQRWRG